MKTIVIYTSQTGFTRRYAEWISGELHCECVPYSERSRVRLEEYDTVIYGGWLMAGSIKNVGWFKAQLPRLEGKRKFVFAVGAMPQCAEVIKMFEANFTLEQRAEISLFYMQGGLDYDRMSGVYRTMMRMLCRMLRAKKSPTPEDAAKLAMIDHSFDASDKSAILSLISAIEKK